MDDLTELVFVPCPQAGHLVSATEIAKLLVARDSRLSISILIFKFPFELQTNTQTVPSSERIKFVDLPRDEPGDRLTRLSAANFLSFFDSQKPHVRDATRRIVSRGTSRLGGFVVDMFCSAMVDVATEFGVPSYVFYTSCAGYFGILSYLQDSGVHLEPGSEVVAPGFVNPVPVRVLPAILLNKDVALLYYNSVKLIRSTKGVLVNTFADLEPDALSYLGGPGFPKVYPVGPILSLESDEKSDRRAGILAWLDEQPRCSVVFLCFGSMGSFGEDQVREIAFALENSGVRFLWALRKPSQMQGQPPLPTEYTDLNEILPEGFLDRTAKVGKIVGWAPQVSLLAHPAVGGFVSHCGWNSILESLWFGVPIATWPLYAEQQFNAFVMVKEFGLSVEISLDYLRKDLWKGTEIPSFLKAEEIRKGIEKLMGRESEVRKRVKEMSEKSRKAFLDGGSSYTSLSCFINDVFQNIA